MTVDQVIQALENLKREGKVQGDTPVVSYNERHGDYLTIELVWDYIVPKMGSRDAFLAVHLI